MLRLVANVRGVLHYFPLPKRKVYLGSTADNGIVLPHPGVSRRHASVTPKPGGVLITDLDSHNGLFVAMRSLKEVFLRPGDHVQVGEVFLSVESVADSDAEIAIELPGNEPPPPRSPRARTESVDGMALPEEENPLRFPPGVVPGVSPASQALYRSLWNNVTNRFDVLLRGETGTGKEVVARLIHDSGPTAGGPFVAVNCAAIPETLLEAELFGIGKNVATGVEPRLGYFAAADGGTLFLDEIGDMPIGLQAKLLRVLQEREVVALGSTSPRKVTVRVIASTHQNLEAKMAQGEFREDLYYRLVRLEYHLPPLRDRKEDIPELVRVITERAARDAGKHIRGVTSAALRKLINLPWPGNIRELEIVIYRAVSACPDGGYIGKAGLADVMQAQPPAAPQSVEQAGPLLVAVLANPQLSLRELEQAAIKNALEITHGNVTAAALRLGITRKGLRDKLNRSTS